MKTEEDEAFDELARRQGAWGYYTYEPICGSIAALFTQECK
jgi:hypothetical protein